MLHVIQVMFPCSRMRLDVLSSACTLLTGPVSDDKKPKLEKDYSNLSSHSAGSYDESNAENMAFRRCRANSFGSIATHASISPSPTTAHASKAMPSIFSGHPQLRSHSPALGSPPAFFARQESNASQQRNAPQLHAPVGASFTDHLHARIAPPEIKDSRLSSMHLAGPLQESDSVGVRRGGSPLTAMLRHDSARSSNPSPTSSAASSNTTATPSSHTSLSMEHRAQRTLPPLSGLGMRVHDNGDFFPASKSPPAQPMPYLKPSFNLSAPSSKSLGSWFSIKPRSQHS